MHRGLSSSDKQSSMQAGLDAGSLEARRFEHMITRAGKPMDGYGLDRGGRKAEPSAQNVVR